MIKMQNVRKTYPGFDFELSLEIPEGRITGLIGKNGAGKSTAIRLMLGLVKAESGTIELFGKPITEIMAEDRQNIGVSLAESGFNGQFTIVEVEKILAKMYPKFEESWFTRECQKLHLPEGKQFKEFSNGMKAKLRVLTALSHKAQLLILDEPSNNVDIPTLTVLEDFLNTFVGIVITVSHDRYFLDNVVDRIFEFDGNGNLLQYEGGYTDYLEAKERRFGGSAEETAKAAPSKTSADEPAKPKNNDWKQNRPTRLKFTFKEQREYETIDDDIAVLEEKIASLDDQMLKNATNSAKLAELMVEKEKTEAALEEKTERWVYLTDLAEQIEAQNQK